MIASADAAAADGATGTGRPAGAAAPCAGVSAGTLWAAVGASRARVAPDVRVVERTVRGRVERVARNETSGAHVRVDATLGRLLARLDGRATVAERLAELLPTAPSAGALESLGGAIATLERAGIVSTGLPGGADRAWRAGREARAAARRQRRDPLSVRVPLVDPDAALGTALAALARVPGRAWGVGATLALGAGALAVATDASAILRAFGALAAEPARWWSLAPTWLVLKLVHELAHALAVRAHGGRVHEAGLAFLVLMPVPYVDASDASLFASRRARALVGAAGMLAELVVAALALALWSALEPGAARDLAFAFAVAGSVSAIALNANPLMRFDGYHVLVDLLGLPNLGPRAAAWWRERLARLALGVRVAPAPGTRAPAGTFERRAFALYGALAWAWRHVVVAGIALWLLGAVPVAGIALAGFALWSLLVRPGVRFARWLAAAPELGGRRARVARRAGVAFALPALVALAVPLPSSVRVQGVVGAGADAAVLAPEAGRIVPGAGALGGAARDGVDVAAGELVGRIEAPELALEAERERARLAGLEARRAHAWRADPVEARALDAELGASRIRAEELADRLDALEIRAPRAGRFVPVADAALPGAGVGRGDALGELVEGPARTVRVAVAERDAGALSAGVREARVRLAEAPGEVRRARLVRIAPAAGRTLPSASLAGAGGTAVARVGDDLLTLEPVFHVELELDGGARPSGLGGRAYVTLVRDPEPLARRWVRSLRQLFLDRLDA